ncbi:RCC1 domain-containing protein [Saccharothrix stipae]
MVVVCALAVLGVHPVAAQADPVARGVDAAQVVDEGVTFVPMAPQRVLDTRTGAGGPVRYRADLDVSAHVPATATAVVFNLTGTEPTAATYVRAWSEDYNVPNFSNLNLAAGETRANLVTAALSQYHRKLYLYNNQGTVHLIADLAGYYTTDAASRFTTTSPTRVLDTRTTAALGPRASREVDLSGQVPASATSVTLNLTGTEPTASTHVIAHPSGATRPVVSNLNLEPGQTVPNLVTVALGANRRITLYNNAGSTHLVADLAGYYAGDRGHRFFPVSPVRAADTREAGGPLGAGQTRVVDLATRIPPSAAAAVLNLTGTNATASTHVTAYPTDTTRPVASNLNLVAGHDTANAAVVALGANARMTLYNNAGSTDLVVDVAGFFASPATCAADCLHAWGGQFRYGSTPARRPWLSGVTAVAAGVQNTLALKSDGTVWSWGDNQFGQLGAGATEGWSNVPLKVSGLSGATAVAVGTWTGYALKSDGTVWSWGWGEAGQLGAGGPVESNVPVRVYGLTGVTAIAATHQTAYALKSDGTVWAWGNDVWGGRGNATCPAGQSCPANTPLRVGLPLPGTTRITAIAAGDSETGYALRSDGTVWAWGRNWTGETGTGSAPRSSVSPTQVVGLTGVVSIAGGEEVGYAVTGDGRVWAWGADYWGTLGTGAPCVDTGTPQVPGCMSSVPVQVSGLTGPVAIDSGSGTTFAVKPDGTVWAWGRNAEQGNIGNGTTGSCGTFPQPEGSCRQSVPVRTTIAGVSRVAAGGLGHFAVVPG